MNAKIQDLEQIAREALKFIPTIVNDNSKV